MRTRLLLPLLALAASLLAACASTPEQDHDLGAQSLELDDMGKPPEGMELFVLAPGADVGALDRALEVMHGKVAHTLLPRLVVGKAPEGAAAVLRDLGVTQRFARAVSPREIAGLTTAEARFVRTFSSRYYPEATPRDELVRPMRKVLSADEPFEESPRASEAVRASAKPDGTPPSDEENERNVYVPYASGTVVISVILPESNGRAEPSTEDWTEESIVETYAKIQAGAEAIARHEPNARLRFVLHYESAPAAEGLEGTIDVDYEYGKHARGSEHLGQIYAQVFSRVLGREVGEWDYWAAQQEYLQGLKTRYGADGAYIVYVAANGNFTAGFRAYASFNGPSTSLDSSYGSETFTHEFGHIFGAYDEYCPDACVSPSAIAGYLGVVNANAQFRTGTWGGIRGGRGESQESLMISNQPNGLNGYTRGAFGWVDSDGDGLIEVRDTFPKSELGAELRDGSVHLVGLVRDVPATSAGAVPFSANRIVALHLRSALAQDAPWVRVPLAGERRGRESVDLDLGALRAGRYVLEARAENSVGNVEPTPVRIALDGAQGDNAAPLVSVESSRALLSPTAPFTLRASTTDLEGDAVRMRFDLDGDGRYDTPFGTRSTYTLLPMHAGVVTLGVEAMDARGARAQARTSVYVLERNAPAEAMLAPLPSPIIGQHALTLAARATDVRDPEGGRAELNFRAERDDAQRTHMEESGFGAHDGYDVAIVTPDALPLWIIDLAGLDGTLDRSATAFDAVRLGDGSVALALGEHGLAFVDVKDPRTPRLLSRLTLQIPAYDLALVDGSLIVLGQHVSVVDVRNPSVPVEVPQARATKHRRELVSTEAWPILEEPAKGLPLWASFAETIEHVRVELAITHPRWEELRISLEAPTGESIVLWDHARSRPGQRSLVVDDTHLEALRVLLGKPARGELRIVVSDDVANGTKGAELERAVIALDTVHRAYEPALEAERIVGIRGRTLVLAGAGLETVDLTRLDGLRRLGLLRSAQVLRAELIDAQVLALATQDPPKGSSDPRPPKLRGLFAVDVSRPSALRTLRADTDVLGDELGVAGTRFYVGHGEKERATSIGSLSRFASGQAKYWLGEASFGFGNDVLGDDRSVWTVRGGFVRFDVQDPAAVKELERFEDPIAFDTRFFDAQRALALGQVSELALVDLSARTSTISETWRVTLQARDAYGAMSESSRTVHVVPYGSAPEITGARFTRATTTRDPYELEVLVHDPDGQPSWDGFLAVRIDWDGDGIWDGPWQGVWGEQSVQSHLYSAGGDYVVRVQARDGFYGLSSVFSVPLHVEAYVPVSCTSSDDCPDGEYCELGEGGACGSAGAGTCERPRTDCGSDEPVCGCDGVTYRSACAANAARAAVAHDGLCEGEVTACGGPERVACSVRGMFCSFPMAETPELSCGAGASFGECRFEPEQCFFLASTGEVGIPRPGRTVCGCDGQTYASTCEAEKAGVSVQHVGACDGPTSDCLATGCAQGEVCMSCWGSYSCVPEGTHC